MSGPAHVLVAVCLPESVGTLSAALALSGANGSELWVVAIGPDAESVAGDAVRMGARRAWQAVVDVGELVEPGYIASLCCEALQTVCDDTGGLSYVCIFGAEASGDAIAAMVSADLGFECIGRLLGIDREGDALEFSRSAYGGRVQIATRLETGSCTCVVQPVKRDVPAIGPPVARVESLDLKISNPEPLNISTSPVDEGGFDLHSARLVFSGGRGLDERGFAYLAELAHSVDRAAVGASLPAVDLGLAPVSWQVGQSGKFVSPDIYLAVGLSGTPQHLAGISKETRIIAINSDPEAPIFSVAEFGIVADWREVLPHLVSAMAAKPVE